MNMKQLKYISVLANEGSFSKAADVLKISQPSLSQYVKKIETQLDVELFDRINGDVRLTNAGEVYVEIARKILDLEYQLQSQLLDVKTFKTGSVTIGTSPYMAAGMMPQIAKRFQDKYPGMHITVREGTTNELMDALEHGECDMCLTLLPVDERVFSYEKIRQEELVLAVPSSYQKLDTENMKNRKYPTIDINQLSRYNFVMLTETQFMQKQLDELVSAYDLKVGVAAVVKSLEAQIAMVKAGVGFALVPSGIMSFCSGDEVRFYSFKQELPKRDVVLIWRKDRKRSRVLQDFTNLMKQKA